MPKVSVGMPVFNGVTTIARAIESILHQSESDLELVISDNASTDGTSEICQRYAAADKRVRYIRQVENLGALSNFERVLREASAQYFFWAPHDDWWDPHFAEAGIRALKEKPDAAAAMGTVRYVDADELEFSRDEPPYGVGAGSALDRVKAYLRSGLTDNLLYALHRRGVLLDAPYVLCAYPEKAIIMHTILAGPIVDALGMEYSNQVSLKSRQQVADTFKIDLSKDREEAKVFWAITGVFRKKLSLTEQVALMPLFVMRGNWHKFFVRSALRSAIRRFSRD